MELSDSCSSLHIVDRATVFYQKKHNSYHVSYRQWQKQQENMYFQTNQ